MTYFDTPIHKKKDETILTFFKTIEVMMTNWHDNWSIFEQNPIYFLLYLLLLDLIGAHTAPYNKHSGHYDLQKMSPLKNSSET